MTLLERGGAPGCCSFTVAARALRNALQVALLQAAENHTCCAAVTDAVSTQYCSHLMLSDGTSLKRVW